MVTLLKIFDPVQSKGNRSYFLFLLFLFLVQPNLHSQNQKGVPGTWTTQLGNPDNFCPVFYELVENKDSIDVFFSLPLFQTKYYIHLPIGKTKAKNDSIAFFSFSGKYISANDKLEGTINLMGYTQPVVLSRISSLPEWESDSCMLADSSGIQWTKEISAEIWSSPVTNGKLLFFGDDAGILHALNTATGQEIWSFKTEGRIRCTPAIQQEKIVFSSDDGNIYALNAATGKLIWKQKISDFSRTRDLPVLDKYSAYQYQQTSPLILGDRIYTGNTDSCLLALDLHTGKTVWKFETHGIIIGKPALANGKVYTGSWDGNIYALEESTGKPVWKVSTDQPITSSVIVSEGIVVAGTRTAYLTGLDAETGKELWRFNYWWSWVESSAFIWNSKILIGSSDLRKVSCLDLRTGKKIWQSRVYGYPWADGIVKDGIFYIGSVDHKNQDGNRPGYLYAIDASTGKKIWKINPGVKENVLLNGFYGTPCFSGKTIFACTTGGKIMSIHTTK